MNMKVEIHILCFNIALAKIQIKYQKNYPSVYSEPLWVSGWKSCPTESSTNIFVICKLIEKQIIIINRLQIMYQKVSKEIILIFVMTTLLTVLSLVVQFSYAQSNTDLENAMLNIHNNQAGR